MRKGDESIINAYHVGYEDGFKERKPKKNPEILNVVKKDNN